MLEKPTITELWALYPFVWILYLKFCGFAGPLGDRKRILAEIAALEGRLGNMFVDPYNLEPTFV